jgi:hypothetical protein
MFHIGMPTSLCSLECTSLYTPLYAHLVCPYWYARRNAPFGMHLMVSHIALPPMDATHGLIPWYDPNGMPLLICPLGVPPLVSVWKCPYSYAPFLWPLGMLHFVEPLVMDTCGSPLCRHHCGTPWGTPLEDPHRGASLRGHPFRDCPWGTLGAPCWWIAYVGPPGGNPLGQHPWGTPSGTPLGGPALVNPHWGTRHGGPPFWENPCRRLFVGRPLTDPKWGTPFWTLLVRPPWGWTLGRPTSGPLGGHALGDSSWGTPSEFSPNFAPLVCPHGMPLGIPSWYSPLVCPSRAPWYAPFGEPAWETTLKEHLRNPLAGPTWGPWWRTP